MATLKRRVVLSRPRRQDGETITQQGLAITPAQMERLTAEGKPIASQRIAPDSIYEGDKSPSFEIPIERQRGIDPADIWDAQQQSRERVRKVRKLESEVSDG